MSDRPEGVPEHFAFGGDPHAITLSHDEVLVLFEFFERLEETDGLRYGHPAEWIALGHLTGQFESIPWEVFDPRYTGLLAAARVRLARGFEGHVPGLGSVVVAADGTVAPSAEVGLHDGT